MSGDSNLLSRSVKAVDVQPVVARCQREADMVLNTRMLDVKRRSTERWWQPLTHGFPIFSVNGTSPPVMSFTKSGSGSKSMT